MLCCHTGALDDPVHFGSQLEASDADLQWRACLHSKN
jgi:hypothetical protein